MATRTCAHFYLPPAFRLNLGLPNNGLILECGPPAALEALAIRNLLGHGVKLAGFEWRSLKFIPHTDFDLRLGLVETERNLSQTVGIASKGRC